MEPVMARKMWRTLEPYHGLIYFSREATMAYAELGVHGRDGYFASRAAPMGAVSAEVVIATFFNFSPELVHRAIPKVWEVVTPERILAARVEAADAALRRAAGPALDAADIDRALELARTAAAGCSIAGRPLYAGHVGLPWPEAPHVALWHAITLLREFRGDGHIACLVEAGLSGIDALIFHAASGEVASGVLQTSREWDDDPWHTAVARLAERGLVDADGSFTEAGAALRQRIENRTDELALAPWEALGDTGCDELRALVRPLSKAIVESGTFGFR